jgi:hypothetical protein
MHRTTYGSIIAFVMIATSVAVLAFGARQAPPVAASEGDTNFTNLVTSGDIEVGDDLTVADDIDVSGSVELDGGFTVDDTAFVVADTTGNTSIAGTLSVTGAVTGPAIGTENLRLPTIDSASVITSTDGALWTVGATEVWYIHRVFCNVTTNFDCDGDDCTLDIGDGTDADGFLDLDDGELQTTDAEISGLPTGWQGFGSTDTRGAYLAAGGGVIESNDTIDITVADTGGTDPTAGAATCYIVYTRLQ